MSNRLNPRDYDIAELRSTLGVEQARDQPSQTSGDRQDGQLIRDGRCSGGVADDEGDWQPIATPERGDTAGIVANNLDEKNPPADEAGAGSTASTEPDDQDTAPEPNGHPRRDTSGGRPGRCQSQTVSHRDRGTRSKGAREYGLDSPHGMADPSKPVPVRLTQLPESFAGQMTILDWLEELTSICGHEGTLDALQFYEKIGWVSAGSREELEAYATGLTEAAPEDTKPLMGTHHRSSLRYVAKLARMP